MSEICPGCGAPFADPADLVQHVKKAHSGGDPDASLAMNPYSSSPGFVCALCGAWFLTPEELAGHGSKPHSKPRRWGRPRPRAGALTA
ncbi:MAG: hypothetical protein L3K09_04820 [Thermoplasmata archaeon]|nr:hypothetical protein [Thermoplasmata archaeon]